MSEATGSLLRLAVASSELICVRSTFVGVARKALSGLPPELLL
jgi:hypothetical protein